MKLTVFLLALCISQVIADNALSQESRLTLDLKNTTIEDVLLQIEEQSNYVFLYNRDLVKVDQLANITVNNLTVDEVLSKLFEDKNVSYKIVDRQIVLSATNQSNIIKLTGKVTDSSGESLPGVTVVINGTTIGTITNFDGVYNLSDVPSNGTIKFSFVGMKTQEILVAGKSSINVTMEEDAIGIEEIVAIGYGTVKKSDLTGSVSSVKAAELEKQGPRVNFVQALQGVAPGLNIRQTGNSANSNGLSIQIRGQNSILASNSPLVILDGVPYDGRLSAIDQSTIESIEVLKDASSAAIYGARGANGVIIISTKKGTIGAPKVTYEGSYGVKQIYGVPDLLTGSEHWDFGVERYSESIISDGYPTRVANYNKGIFTDWVKESTRLGTQNKHSLSISGGADKVKYFISGSFLDVKGISLGDNFKNASGRVNLTLNPTNWLEIGTNSQYSSQDNSGVAIDLSGGFSGAFFMNPLISPYNEDGNVALHPWPENPKYTNPLSNRNVLNESFTRRIISNNYVDIDIPFIKGLSYKLNTGINYQVYTNDSFWGDKTIQGVSNKGQASTEESGIYSWLIENLVFYKKEIGDHSFNFTALYSSQKDTYDKSTVYSRGFPTEALTWYQSGAAEYVENERNYTQETYLSQMARLIYSFQEKYMLTATIRRDGYSAFGSKKKFGVFPSMAIGWNMKRESFLIDTDVLSQLKIRLSYGLNGNQAIKPYSTLAKVSGNDYLTGPNGDVQGVGFTPSTLENANLGWETTSSFNLGIDFGFLSNKITGALELYQSNTKDLLLNRTISSINGITAITSNIGEVENSGVEFMLSSINIDRNDFKWITTFNISNNKNSIVDLYGDGQDDVGNNWFIGKPIDINYAYEYDGVWQLDDDIANSTQPSAQPGDVKIKDANGDGEITSDDRTFIGQRSPKFTIGLNNSIQYKNFNLSFQLSAIQGVTKVNSLWDTDVVYADAIRNTLKQNWWSENNPTNDYPANRDGANPYGIHFYQDASFIRLNNLSLSYDFKNILTTTSAINDLRMVFSLVNGLTITKWNGLDPEFSNQRSTPLDRVYSLGVNVTF